MTRTRLCAVQNTMQSKYWNNATGWREIVNFLKDAGYRIIGIDQKRSHGVGLIWNHLPDGVEDQTGDRPLVERARWLKHADFFIGLSSGLCAGELYGHQALCADAHWPHRLPVQFWWRADSRLRLLIVTAVPAAFSVSGTSIHADFFELVEKCVGFAQIAWITELSDQIGGPHQQTLFLVLIV
jgi:hypothetical protein